jgi:hypothetical protein
VGDSGGAQTLRNDSEYHRAETIPEQLGRLPHLKRRELQGLWRELYGSDPSKKISHQLMRQAVAHRLQVKQFGGLTFSTRRALKRVDEPRSSGRSHSKGRAISNGTVLIRDWHGATHQVTVTRTGVMYRKKLYRSPSEVAREITGTRWSGPLFFGLRGASKPGKKGKKSEHGAD